jgi:hypothetical protein
MEWVDPELMALGYDPCWEQLQEIPPAGSLKKPRPITFYFFWWYWGLNSGFLEFRAFTYLSLTTAQEVETISTFLLWTCYSYMITLTTKLGRGEARFQPVVLRLHPSGL